MKILIDSQFVVYTFKSSTDLPIYITQHINIIFINQIRKNTQELFTSTIKWKTTLKMIDQVKHEADREMEISKSVKNIIDEIIKNSKGRQTIIETLEKVEDSEYQSKSLPHQCSSRRNENP